MAYTIRLREWLGAVLARCPADCPLCGVRAAGGGLCTTCELALHRSVLKGGPRCSRCALSLDLQGICHDCEALKPAFDKVFMAFDYVFPGTLLIHQLKRQRRFLLARMLADDLARQVRASTSPPSGDTILLPVPASQRSLRERGFSPAAELARHLGRALGLPCRTDVLYRCQEVAPQKLLARRQRLAAVPDLYACHGGVNGRAVALVDDVMTTGATLHSLSQVLKQAGAASVSALVVARTPLRERID